VTDLRSQLGRLDACDEGLAEIATEVADLTTQLQRLQDHAGRLDCLLCDHETVIAAKDRELSRLAAMATSARIDADRSSRALEDVTTWTGTRDAEVAALQRELTAMQREVMAREAQLADARAELERLARASEASQTGECTEARGHVRFLGLPEGYRLEISDEPCAGIGELMQIDGRSFRVERIGRSPLPADDRPCAFLVS
jgi:chromosome segregation ATPase